MTKPWRLRSESRTDTKQFVEGGFVAIGRMPDTVLSAVKSRGELYPLNKQTHPDDTSNIVIGQQVGQIARFLLDIEVGDYVIVKVFVQAKRYKLGAKVNVGTVIQLRPAIPFGGQGAFIATADFQSAAAEVALEAEFPRIGLIHGRQLVDLLIEHWDGIPPEFRDLLGLKPGLVRT